MRRERAIRIALTFAAALLLLSLGVATTDTAETAPPAAVGSVANVELAAVSAPDEGGGVVARLFESVPGFVRQISRSLERGDDVGAIIRLLIIVEVLIASLGAVSSVTAGGKVKAELIYRIVDVMGALFIIIALLLLGMTAL